MAESRQGTQVIAVMWNGKCVGKLFERMELVRAGYPKV